MDPTACFERLIDALVEGDEDEAGNAARDLAQWVRKGGGVPLALRHVYEEVLPLVHADNIR